MISRNAITDTNEWNERKSYIVRGNIPYPPGMFHPKSSRYLLRIEKLFVTKAVIKRKQAFMSLTQSTGCESVSVGKPPNRDHITTRGICPPEQMGQIRESFMTFI